MANIFDRDTVGAFCRHTHVEVAGTAGGPLAGLTCGIKDLYDIAGYKTGFGSPAWLATPSNTPKPSGAGPPLRKARTASASATRSAWVRPGAAPASRAAEAWVKTQA